MAGASGVVRVGFGGVVLLALFAGGCNPSAPTPPVDQFPEGPHISCPAAPPAVTSPTGQPISVQFGSATATGGAPTVGVVCAPASGAMFTVGSTAVVCTATDARQRTNSCTFNVVVQSPPRLSVTRFVAFGDSITWGEDGRDSNVIAEGSGGGFQTAVQFPAQQTYPGALQIQLQGRYSGQTIDVANAGKKGESAGDPAALSRFVDAVTGGFYNVALLMEGSNDLADRDSRAIPPAINNLQSMIHAAKDRKMRTYLATVPPMVPGAPRGLPWSLVPTLNDQLRSLAAAEGVEMVDVYAAFGSNFQQYIGADGLHPNADGYAKIADTFFAAIKRTLEATSSSSLGVRAVPFVRPRR